jgi:nucleotidyltransferase/DNA polymerase involved in DNA repair
MTLSILDVHGIGQATSVVLAEYGFKTAEDLAKTTIVQLAATPGFSETRATQVIKDARSLVASNDQLEKPAKVKSQAKNKKPSKSAKKSKKDKKTKQKQDSKKKKGKTKDKKAKKKKSKKKSKK